MVTLHVKLYHVATCKQIYKLTYCGSMLESTVMVFRCVTSNLMAANMGIFMNKDIPQFLKGRPLYFIRSCMNTFQNAIEQFHEDMIKEIIPLQKYEV